MPPPPPCSVRDNTAALLVTMKCVKTVICDIHNGVAVVDVVIDKVFEDKTGTGLSAGDMATVRSVTEPFLCGTGSSFEAETQWILFVNTSRQGGLSTSVYEDFSDGSICEVGDADLSTDSCAGNIREPTQAQIDEQMNPCR